MIKKEKSQPSLESIMSALGSLDKKFDKRFDGADKRFDALEVRIENLERSHRNMGLQLDKLEHKFDLCIEGFGGLNEQASKLEGRVSIFEGLA
jgi:chromosome segregation ATPase